jgi:hypothetical protein
VRDGDGQQLVYVYYESEPGRRSAAKLLTKDEARRMAANIAKLVSSMPAPRIHSPSTRRVCSIRISSAMLVRDSRTSSVNGAFGRHERHDSEGMRLVTAASR